MGPPQVPDGFSGLFNCDHRHLLRLTKQLGLLLGGDLPGIAWERENYWMALNAAYSAIIVWSVANLSVACQRNLGDRLRRDREKPRLRKAGRLRETRHVHGRLRETPPPRQGITHRWPRTNPTARKVATLVLSPNRRIQKKIGARASILVLSNDLAVGAILMNTTKSSAGFYSDIWVFAGERRLLLLPVVFLSCLSGGFYAPNPWLRLSLFAVAASVGLTALIAFLTGFLSFLVDRQRWRNTRLKDDAGRTIGVVPNHT